MTRLIDTLIRWYDKIQESPRLKMAGFYFCQKQWKWMLGDRVFPTRNAAMEYLRNLTVEQALRKAVTR